MSAVDLKLGLVHVVTLSESLDTDLGIKFLLKMSLLDQTIRSREQRKRSPKINRLDVYSNSPNLNYNKNMESSEENMLVDTGGLKV